MAEHYPHFDERVRIALKVVLGNEVESRIKIGMAKDGSGVGGKHHTLQFLAIHHANCLCRLLSCTMCAPGNETTLTRKRDTSLRRLATLCIKVVIGTTIVSYSPPSQVSILCSIGGLDNRRAMYNNKEKKFYVTRRSQT